VAAYPVNDGEVTPVFGFGLVFFFVAGLRLAFVHQGFVGTPAQGFGIVARFLGNGCMITVPFPRGY
jgi:hypothetical protein